jgi:predicted secreted protein
MAKGRGYTGRMAGVAFVAHCLLNQNAKTLGGARTSGIYAPVVDVLRAQGWRIEQMPCPELAFTGLNRFWAVKEQYDTVAFRRHCRRLATAVASAMAEHVQAGEELAIIGIEGSPSMGVCVTSSDPTRGGRPEWADGTDELAPGQGIFIEELRAEMAGRGLPEPRLIGIRHQLPDHDAAGERSRLTMTLAR